MLSSITDILTPDDLRVLIETEDENSRRGSFIRVFPNSDSKKYLKYFETTRYYNLLLSEWCKKFKNIPDKGIALINLYCKRNVHLQNPAESSENQVSKFKINIKK
jgi:tubulin polyglutamylase TTLL4